MIFVALDLASTLRSGRCYFCTIHLITAIGEGDEIVAGSDTLPDTTRKSEVGDRIICECPAIVAD